jgi:hypothetical protein
VLEQLLTALNPEIAAATCSVKAGSSTNEKNYIGIIQKSHVGWHLGPLSTPCAFGTPRVRHAVGRLLTHKDPESREVE